MPSCFVGRLRPVVILFAIVAAFAATPAIADDDPPVIEHVPVTRAERGAVVTIVARITDASDVFAATLFHRLPGAAEASSVPLQQRRSDRAFVATLTATADLEYWLEAYDEHGNGPALFGTPSRPHRMAVAGSPVASVAPVASVSAVAAIAPATKSDVVVQTGGEGSEGQASDASLDLAIVPLVTEAPVAASDASARPSGAVVDAVPDVVADTVASASSASSTTTASVGNVPAAALAPTPASVTSPGASASGSSPFHTQWWFFTGAGAVAAGVVTTVVVLALQPEPEYRNTFGLSVAR